MFLRGAEFLYISASTSFSIGICSKEVHSSVSQISIVRMKMSPGTCCVCYILVCCFIDACIQNYKHGDGAKLARCLRHVSCSVAAVLMESLTYTKLEGLIF
jgi:hypothetical protein